MKPISYSENLIFNTVRLETNEGSSGTGFFYSFNIGEKTVPILITNKHVVNYNPNEEINFLLHLKEEDGTTKQQFNVKFNTNWNFHSKHDLCFTYVNDLFTQIKEITGKEVFCIAADNSLVYDNDRLKELSALEEIVMVGYPIGLWDKKNNFPIFRKGYTASHPGYDFNNEGQGLVDIACFPGSSGSPIYILNENIYSDKTGNTHIKSRLIFLGVLFGGPVYNSDGIISIKDIPTQQVAVAQTQLMVNLGYYIKAFELEEFGQIIEKDIENI